MRFQGPATSRRPYGTHRFEVWSPKIQRRLTLFGQRALRAWVAIESDLTILEFCERPLVTDALGGASRVIDFWVRRAAAGGELWLLPRPRDAPHTQEADGIRPSFSQWMKTNGLALQFLGANEPALTEDQFRNWGVALRYLAANRALLGNELVESVREVCGEGLPLQVIEGRLSQHDPILVRTALFQLLQQGAVRAPEFARAPIDSSMRFHRA